jgi:prepilin-type N-terminal cleavage/methylation domain-containing protein
MKRQNNIFAQPKGMTLVEVLVTIAILSLVLGVTLTLYSTTFRNIRIRESLLYMLHDADLIMSSIGDDIRHTDEFLKDYHAPESHVVVAAMKTKNPSKQAEERVIVYSLDAERPNRLIRSVHRGEDSTSVELSTFIRKLEIIPTTERLFKVNLLLEDEVAGKVETWQASSAFALRY